MERLDAGKVVAHARVEDGAHALGVALLTQGAQGAQDAAHERRVVVGVGRRRLPVVQAEERVEGERARFPLCVRQSPNDQYLLPRLARQSRTWASCGRTSSYVVALRSASLSRPRSPRPVDRCRVSMHGSVGKLDLGHRGGEGERRTAGKELDDVDHLADGEVGDKLEDDDEEDEELQGAGEASGRLAERAKEEEEGTHEERPARDMVGPPLADDVLALARVLAALALLDRGPVARGDDLLGLVLVGARVGLVREGLRAEDEGQ